MRRQQVIELIRYLSGWASTIAVFFDAQLGSVTSTVQASRQRTFAMPSILVNNRIKINSNAHAVYRFIIKFEQHVALYRRERPWKSFDRRNTVVRI